jgi:copper(I)-binding protein
VVYLLSGWHQVKDRWVDATVEEQTTTAAVLQLITHSKALHWSQREEREKQQ